MSSRLMSCEVRAMFPEVLNGERFFFADTFYEVPTKKWLLGPFYGWFRKGILSPLGLVSYEDAKWDCDDFARMYAASAEICHKKSDKKNSALAVGEMWFRQDNGQKHAICVAITDAGRVFIEPQSGKEVELSLAEIKSSWFVRF